MFNSLKYKLLFYFFISKVVVLLSFSYFIYSTAQKGELDKMDAQLKLFSIDVIEHLVTPDSYNPEKINNFLREEFRETDLYTNIIYYNKKIKIKINKNILVPSVKNLFKIPLNITSKLNDIYYYNRLSYRVSSMLIIEKGDTKVFFQLAIKKITDTPYLKNLKLYLLIITPIIILVFLLIANFLINKILYPVNNVINSVNDISTKNLSKRIESNNLPIEIKKLVNTFNIMLDNIEDSFSRISSFSSDASHELRTPLTVIRGEIEVALRKDRDIKEYKNIFNIILGEIIFIQDIIDQLLLLSQKDTEILTSNIQEIYFDELINEVVVSLSSIAKEKSVELIIKDILLFTVYANESLLKVAISNLIRNAILYSDKDSKVLISLTNEFNEYILKIQDEGCGISNKDIPYIFDRFFRVDNVRSRHNSGLGLGLSLVKMILDIYKYDIKIVSKLGIGTTIIVKFNMNKM